MYASVGEYEEARKHLEKSLVIQKEIGDRRGEAGAYANLGIVYRSLGEYEKAREHLEKSLTIQKEIGNRNGEAASYLNLGALYLQLANMRRLQSTIKNHYLSSEKLVTDIK